MDNKYIVRKSRSEYSSKLYKQVLFSALEKNTKRNIDKQFPKLLGFGFDHITNFISVFGRYEDEELAAYKTFAEHHQLIKGVAVDAGANIGNHSVYFSELYTNVFSYEPNPVTFEVLKINTASHGNITVFPIGLSSKRGAAKLGCDDTNNGSGRIGEGDIEIRLERLDDVPELVDKPIGLIKIDVEGHEYDLISGAKATILKNLPLILFEQHPLDFEINGKSPVIELLKSLGYDRFVTIAKMPEAPGWMPRIIKNFVTASLRLIFGYRLELKIQHEIPVGFYYFIVGLHKNTKLLP
jgi:FkbM family methyltransferase